MSLWTRCTICQAKSAPKSAWTSPQAPGQTGCRGRGGRAGFGVLDAVVEDYSVELLPGHRGPRKGQPQFGIIEVAGRLEVTDPAIFLDYIGKGFGRAKAFGCGLMLVRRLS